MVEAYRSWPTAAAGCRASRRSSTRISPPSSSPGGSTPRRLLLLTDVDGVYQGWGTDDAVRLEQVSVAQLWALDLPAGSMGPKVDAVGRFVQHTGRFAAIGALADAEAILRGEAGTIVVR